MEQRPTQLNVAKIAGVSRATVSMALRNHPAIPKETQEKIKKIATKIGYRPDPMLSSLASYRNNKAPKAHQGTLAWLVNNAPPFDWTKASMFVDYYRGAKKRADQLGYTLDTFDYHPYHEAPEKLARILRSRNIDGVLVCPQPSPNTTLRFPWQNFSSMTFGFSLAQPLLHVAAPSQFRDTSEIMKRLHQLGYKRIGFACSLFTDEKTDHNFLAGYLVGKYQNDKKIDIPPLDEHHATYDSFCNWYNTHKPDAIVISNPRILDWLKKAHIKIPQQLGVACTSLPPHSDLAGIMENSQKIGEAAVDFLVGMIMHGIRDIPTDPQYIFIRGKWQTGKSIKRQK